MYTYIYIYIYVHMYIEIIMYISQQKLFLLAEAMALLSPPPPICSPQKKVYPFSTHLYPSLPISTHLYPFKENLPFPFGGKSSRGATNCRSPRSLGNVLFYGVSVYYVVLCVYCFREFPIPPKSGNRTGCLRHVSC